jgi:hypothetical protein
MVSNGELDKCPGECSAAEGAPAALVAIELLGGNEWMASAPMLSALDELVHQHDDECAQLTLLCTAPSFQAVNARYALLDCDAMRCLPPDGPGEATCAVGQICQFHVNVLQNTYQIRWMSRLGQAVVD